ncbi:MAG: hypothetical protein V3U80_02900 [Flavobacteriaceae bacterium]
MKKHNFIGKVTLEEKIYTVKSVSHPKALIIDVPNPLAAYYTRFTDIQKPNSIVLITKDANSYENILRSTKNVNNKHQLNLEGAKCEVQIGTKKLNGIRLKGVGRYTHIDTILDHYKDEGFDFNTNKRLKNEELALIRVNKFFDVEEVNDTVLRSATNKNEYYFKLDNALNWNEFKEKTKSVKHNVSASGFDIAQAILYNKGEINDIVRVIKPDLSLDLVKEIEKKYR